MTELLTQPCPDDPVQHRPGSILYNGLQDRLFGVPGRWSIRAHRGMYWLDPAPDPEDILKAYVNYHTHGNADARTQDPAARVSWYYKLREQVWASLQASDRQTPHVPMPWQARLPPVREQLYFDRGFLPIVPRGKLLDVGCGSGGLVELLNRLGWDAKGIDPDPRAVERARALNRPVSEAGVEALSQMDEQFDAMTLIHVIEHIYQPTEVLKTIHRLLKPGGYIVIVTPNARSLVSRMFGRHWRGLEPPRHLQVFFRHTLKQVLQDLGYMDVSVRTSFRDASGMFCASHAIRKGETSSADIQPTRMVRLLGDITLVFEYLLTRFGLPLGEELVAVARRP